MTNSPRIDMSKVEAAAQRYCAAPVPEKAQCFRGYLVKTPPIAEDSARRKTLTSHGDTCRGWDHPSFLHD